MLVWAVIASIGLVAMFPDAYAQTTIDVNQTEPCFLNQTATASEVLQNCEPQRDYLEWVISPWEWVTGGWFTGIIIGSLIIGVYAHTGKALYGIVIGVILLPTSFFLFPPSFASFAIIIAFIAIGLLIAYIYVRNTKTN